MAELKKDLRFISHRCGQDSENDISARETLTSNILQSFHTSVHVDTQVHPPISPGSCALIINIQGEVIRQEGGGNNSSQLIWFSRFPGFKDCYPIAYK